MKYYVRFPGGLSKAVTLSYDDGVETDIRLIEIMKANGLKGAFNLNSGVFAPEGTVYPAGQAQRRMPLSQIISTYTGSGMELATHGFTHPFFEKLTEPRMVYEIMADRARIEELFGGVCRGHAYPFGTYSQKVVDVMRSCGIVYARTVKSTESFSLPAELLTWHPTAHHRNPKLGELLGQFLDKEFRSDAGLFYLWGHSYEFDGSNNWYVIEQFAEKAGGHGDIWYANNIDIADCLRAFAALEFSANGLVVRNPSATDVWLRVSGSGTEDFEGLYKIEAGRTLAFEPSVRLEK